MIDSSLRGDRIVAGSFCCCCYYCFPFICCIPVSLKDFAFPQFFSWGPIPHLGYAIPFLLPPLISVPDYANPFYLQVNPRYTYRARFYDSIWFLKFLIGGVIRDSTFFLKKQKKSLSSSSIPNSTIWGLIVTVGVLFQARKGVKFMLHL